MSIHPEIKPIERGTVVRAVSEKLLEAILSGSLKAGERLPPERELAARFGVNRLTLRAALSRLEAMALIDTHHGTGTVVRDYRASAGIETFGDLVRVGREREPALFVKFAQDIFEIRRAIAVEAIVLAAERHTDTEIDQMRAAVEAQRDDLDDVVEFARADLDFARLIVRASHNVALELLFNSIMRLPEADPTLLRLMYPSPRVQHRHNEVLIELIASRDAARARDAVRVALEEIDRITLERLRRELVDDENASARTERERSQEDRA